MIQLRQDCLALSLPSGEAILCNVQAVAVEIIGAAAHQMDPALIEQAAVGVLHYFKKHLERESVSLSEFSLALEQALQRLGLDCHANAPLPEPQTRVAEVDLRLLADVPGQGLELALFAGLRAALRSQLLSAPQLVHCHGLRDCVKQTLGARRWDRRCRQLRDQIVVYLRHCWSTEAGTCVLIVS
jgi:hypothetical protein